MLAHKLDMFQKYVVRRKVLVVSLGMAIGGFYYR
jgi:hypothetical protein